MSGLNTPEARAQRIADAMKRRMQTPVYRHENGNIYQSERIQPLTPKEILDIKNLHWRGKETHALVDLNNALKERDQWKANN